MNRADVVARDPRVGAILTRPDDYFTEARRRAWAQARDDIAADLDRRAWVRRNGFGAQRRAAAE